ncbi:MAG: hypothetical protein IKM11_03180 [Oscillospiraceae bacterium]|nr:hypothetical protein [Oscillospiraceae bacterium]
MNYKWARDFTMQLINRYSTAGASIPAHYNDQADCLARIPKLLDDAQMLAATTAAPILCSEALGALRCDENGGWLVYTLPEDCRQMCSAGLVRYDGDTFERYHRYRIVGANKFAVPKELGGEIHVEYFRYPHLLGETPDDTDELDNTQEVQMALPYYAAAYLVMQDDAFAFSALSNEFEARLTKLKKQPHADISIVQDAYGA